MSMVKFKDVEWGDPKFVEFSNYWNQLRTSDQAPFQKDFNPADVKHLLPGIAIYELLENGGMNCRLMGTGLAEDFGWDITSYDFLGVWDDADQENVRRHFKALLDRNIGLYVDLVGLTEKDSEVYGSSVCLPALDADSMPTRMICLTVAKKRPGMLDSRADKVVQVKALRMCNIDFA